MKVSGPLRDVAMQEMPFYNDIIEHFGYTHSPSPPSDLIHWPSMLFILCYNVLSISG